MSLSNKDEMSIVSFLFLLSASYRSDSDLSNVAVTVTAEMSSTLQPAELSLGLYVRSSWLYHNGQEVSGCVFPPRPLSFHWLSVGVQSHKHVLLLVAPLS